MHFKYEFFKYFIIPFVTIVYILFLQFYDHMIKITFLGTSGGLPTKDRNPSAVLMNFEGESLLFDCGEGTQRQMMRAKTGMHNLTHIFLSHMHADHVLGVPGLLQTMDFQSRESDLYIYGPEGIVRFMNACDNLGLHKLKFTVHVKTLQPEDIVQTPHFSVRAVQTDHGVMSLGYIFETKKRPGRFNRQRAVEVGVPPGPLFAKLHRGESVTLSDGRTIDPNECGIVGSERPGLKITYSGDTRESEIFFKKAAGSDLLIHESSFSQDLSELAAEWNHSTAGGVARLSKKYNIQKLALVHISPRFSDDASVLLKEASEIFENTFLPNDLDVVEIFPKEFHFDSAKSDDSAECQR